MLTVIIVISHMGGGHIGVGGGGVGAVRHPPRRAARRQREARLLSTQSTRVHTPRHVHIWKEGRGRYAQVCN